MTIEIKFWGVRGSIASPGKHTQLVGGNTSCVELGIGNDVFILDAGTGIRNLGDHLMRRPCNNATVFLSHLHWDHIQGLPFFAPLYSPRFTLDVYGPQLEARSLRSVFAAQMVSPVFPVELSMVRSRVEFKTFPTGTDRRFGDLHVTTGALTHPGGSMAYRFDFDETSVVYATDHELGLSKNDSLAHLAAGVDTLIIDAQYLPTELHGEPRDSRRGWGHSSYAEAAAFARSVGVEQLVLFHHDPLRDDLGIAAIEREAQQLHPRCIAAREGESILVNSRRFAA